MRNIRFLIIGIILIVTLSVQAFAGQPEKDKLYIKEFPTNKLSNDWVKITYKKMNAKDELIADGSKKEWADNNIIMLKNNDKEASILVKKGSRKLGVKFFIDKNKAALGDVRYGQGSSSINFNHDYTSMKHYEFVIERTLIGRRIRLYCVGELKFSKNILNSTKNKKACDAVTFQ